MYNWLNGFYRVMNTSNSRHISLLRPRPSIVSIASAVQKSNRTCLIGYSGFISREWFLIADTHIHTHTHTHTYINFPDKSNFKKPGTRLV